MKKRSLIFLTLLFFLCSIHRQSQAQPGFVPNRPDLQSKFNTPPDLKKLAGTWVSLDGASTFTIYQLTNTVLIGGDYFPGVAKNGDMATLAVRNNPEQGYDLVLSYAISHTAGPLPIAYSPSMDHLVVSTPPYVSAENGNVINGATFSNKGIFGKEFRRVKSNGSAQKPVGTMGTLHIDLITVKPQGFETPNCSYSKIRGEAPIFLSDIAGRATMKINGVFINLKLSKTAKDVAGKLNYTYSGDNFEVTLKTGVDFRKGTLTVKSNQKTTQTPIVGNCSTDGGD